MRRSERRRAGLSLGVAERGEGRTIVFQHGLCADASQPLNLFPQGLGWRCDTLECRGHGASEPGLPEDHSMATFVDDLIALIESRAMVPVAIGGISMGAAMAVRLATQRADLVSALVLFRPARFAAPVSDNMAPNAYVGDLLRRFAPDEARRLFEASDLSRFLAREAPDNLASLQGFFSREPLAVTQQLLCRTAADGPCVSADHISAIDAPTLVIGCARDFVRPLAVVRRFGDAMAGAFDRSRRQGGRFRGLSQ
jgi:pimeloyl-ACP methyl ester carboxylesterase